MKKVTISTVMVGQHFGSQGVIKSRTTRVIARGPVRPYGALAVALDDVRALADRLGFTVVDSDGGELDDDDAGNS